MKWNLKVLALVAMSLAAFSAVADDYFDDEDPDSCWAPFGTNLDGYLLDTTGKKKIASVEIRETRGTRTGSSFLKMTVTPTGSKTSIVLTRASVKFPARTVLMSADGNYRSDVTCDVKLEGSYYSGLMYGTLTGGAYDGCQFRVASPDVDINSETKFNPNIDFKGYWGVVFLPSDAEGGGADVVKDGFIFASVNVANNGKVKTTVYMPSGLKLTSSGTFATEGGNTVVPVKVSRSFNGGKETFSFKLVWNNSYAKQGLALSDALRVQDVSLWATDAKAKTPFTIKPLCLGAGLPAWTVAKFKSAKKTITLPEGATQTTVEKLTYKPATGMFTGAAKVIAPGTSKAVNMQCYGIEVNGQGWGFCFLKNKFSGWIKIKE